MNPLTKSLYRVLIRKARIFDRHHPLKAMIGSLNEDTSKLIRDSCSFYSVRYESDLHQSSHSILHHIRITFDFIRSHRKIHDDAHHLSQIGFDAIKSLSTALELAEFIEYDVDYMESLPESKYIPIRQSTPIQNALSSAEEAGDDDEDAVHNINSSCMFIKLGNASTSIEERIGYYIKSINAFETADAFTFLGWTVYSHAVRRKETESSRIQQNEEGDSENPKMSLMLSSMLQSGDSGHGMIDELKQEILDVVNGDDQYLLSLSAEEAMFFCMKCDRVAAQLDPQFGNSWNDLGICVMNQLFISDQSDQALALFEKAKQCERYSCREFAFVNAARLYLRHKKDLVPAIRNYLGALYFNRDETEALNVIREYRPSLISAMRKIESTL